MSAVRVIVYATTDEHCPPAQRFTARTFVNDKPMPVTHYATTEPAVRGAAMQWWNDQLEAERKRAAFAERKRAAFAERKRAAFAERLREARQSKSASP